MKHLFYVVILVTLGYSRSAQAEVCGLPELSLEGMQSRATDFIRNMKIAAARGDLEGMNDAYHNFYNLGLSYCIDPVDLTVHEDYSKICGIECHIQLGQYHQFMSGEIQYYYTKASNDIPDSKPEDMLKHSNLGIEVMDRAEALLTGDGMSGDLRDYVAQASRFNFLRALLYMGRGDIFYRSVSEARLERLGFIADESMRDGTEGDENSASEFEQAKAMYEKANWIIQSAALEIPQDDSFSRQLVQVATLKNDLQRRMDSLNQGMIFIGIDPERFVRLSIPALENDLQGLLVRITNVENSITTMIRSWQESKANRDTETVNEQRQARETNIAQSSYRIAKIEASSQEMLNEFEGQLEVLRQEQQDVSYLQQKYELEMSLKLKVQELQQRKDLLMSKKEVDILSLDIATKERRLSDLRFMMNWEVSKANIEVQLSQFETEITQYDNQLASKDLEKKQTDNRIDAIEQNILSLGNKITETQNQRQLLSDTKNLVNKERLRGIEIEICNALNQIKFIDPSKLPSNIYDFQLINCQLPSYDMNESKYQDLMCGANGLRQQLANQNLNTVEDALCVIGEENLPDIVVNDPAREGGLDCSRVDVDLTQREFANQIYEKEKELAQLRIQNLMNQANQLNDDIDEAKSLFKETMTQKITLEGVLLVAQTLKDSSASVPRTVSCACGLASGVSIDYDPSKIGQSLYESALYALENYMTWQEYQTAHKAEVEEMTRQLDLLEQNVAEATLQKAITDETVMKAAAELLGQSQDLGNQWGSRLIELNTTIVECNSSEATLTNKIQVALNNYEQLLTNASLIGYENGQLNINIANTRLQEKNYKNDIEIQKLEKANLQIELSKIARDIASINEVKDQIVNRQKIIEALQSRLNGLEQGQNALSNAITELNAIHNDKYLALSDQEFDQIEAVIRQNESYTDGLAAFADELHELAGLDGDIRSEIISYKEDVLDQVSAERDKMLALAELQEEDLDSGKVNQIFMAKEEIMAELTNGVPEFVSQKRRLLERANELLVLYRNQARVVMSLADDDPLSLANSETPILAKTASDLEQMIDITGSELWNGERQIPTNSVSITVPASCGLARQLSSDRRASFEISPFALGQMEQLGCYAMWYDMWSPDSNGLTQNLMLIDMNLEINFKQEGCDRNRIQVWHQGDGYIFKSMSNNDPTLVPRRIVAASRYNSPSFVTDYEGSELERFSNWWIERNFYVNNFPGREIPIYGDQMPAFMGLPLIGFYDLYLPNPGEGCSYQGANYVFHIAYSTTQNIHE